LKEHAFQSFAKVKSEKIFFESEVFFIDIGCDEKNNKISKTLIFISIHYFISLPVEKIEKDET